MAGTRLKYFVTLWSIPLERSLREHLPSGGELSDEITGEIERVLFPGTQRIAGLSVLAAGRAVGGSVEPLLPTASAFEYLSVATQSAIESGAGRMLALHAESLLFTRAGLKIVDVVEGLALDGEVSRMQLFSAALVVGARVSQATPEQLEAMIEVSLLAANFAESAKRHFSLPDRLHDTLAGLDLLSQLLELYQTVDR